jgi:hypothetical protein
MEGWYHVYGKGFLEEGCVPYTLIEPMKEES